MNAAFALVAAALAGLATMAVMRWAVVRTNNLRIASKELDRYQAAVQRLIKDESVPLSVVDFLRRFAVCVGRPQVIRALARDVMSGKFGAPGALTKDQRALRNDMDKMSDEQKKIFAEAMVFGLLASASSDLLLATYYRRAVAFAFFRQSPEKAMLGAEQTQDIAVDLVSNRRWARMGDCELVAA